MIDVEVWWSGRGSEPAWRGDLPVIPRVGERLHIGTTDGYVSEVYWWVDASPVRVHIFLTKPV